MMDLATVMMWNTSGAGQMQKSQSNQTVDKGADKSGDKSFRDILSKVAEAKDKPKEEQSDSMLAQAASGEAVEPLGEQTSPAGSPESGKATGIVDLESQGTSPTLFLIGQSQEGQALPGKSGDLLQETVLPPTGTVPGEAVKAETGENVLSKESLPAMSNNVPKEVPVPKAPQTHGEAQTNMAEMPVEEAGEMKKANEVKEATGMSKQTSGELAQGAEKVVKAVDTKTQSYGTQEGQEGSEKPTLTNQQAPTLDQTSSGEKLFVKVSEGNTVAQPEKFVADLGEKILYQASEGRQEFDIQLTPEDLGKITIKLIFEGGKASVLYHCSNPQTQQALAASAEQLRNIVEAGTGRPTEVSPGKGSDQMTQQQSHSDQRGENQARDEQQQRMNQSYRIPDRIPDRNEVTTFMDRFRLGLAQ